VRLRAIEDTKPIGVRMPTVLCRCLETEAIERSFAYGFVVTKSDVLREIVKAHFDARLPIPVQRVSPR
jgi:hypothetical protein